MGCGENRAPYFVEESLEFGFDFLNAFSNSRFDFLSVETLYY